MKDELNNPFEEAGLRGEITPGDRARLEAWLREHPQLRESCEADQALNTLLRRLPDAPVSNNFTAQVMAAVALENARRVRAGQGTVSWRSVLRRLLPRIAVAGLVLGVAGISILEYRGHQRQALARAVAEVGAAASVVPVDALKDFEAIYRLGKVPVEVDEQLYSALQ